MKKYLLSFMFAGVMAAGITSCEMLGLQKVDASETEARNQREKASRIAKRYEEAFNSRDAKAVAALYKEDASVYMPGSTEPVKGREELEKTMASMFKAFPDVKSETVTTMADGNKFVMEGIMGGTNSGPMAGPKGEMPATNKPLEMRYVMVATLDDSLISEDRTYYDLQNMMKQLYPNGMPSAKGTAPVKKKKRR